MNPAAQIRELSRREEHRYVDMAMLLRRGRGGETLLCAGGVWDQVDQAFRINPLNGQRTEPSSARIMTLNEAQTPLARWYALELAKFSQGYKRANRMALAIGDRRSGKTVGTCALATSTAIEVPRVGWHGLIAWVVGPARPEMQELDRYLSWMMPAAWYRQGIQDHVYRLITGAEVYTISADNPRTLKRGEANIVLINEAQKMPVMVLSNAIMGTVDNDGVCLLAANPPEDRRGYWVWQIRKGVKQGIIPATEVFDLQAKDNEFLDQDARTDALRILEIIDPDAARIDGGGECLLDEGKALPWFDPQIHVKPTPDEVADISSRLVNITRLVTYRRVGKAFASAIGLDFQNHPYMPAVEYEVYGTRRLREYLEDRIEASQLDPETDAPHYWIVNEAHTPTNSHEHDLADVMYEAGMRRERSYCVGDASGTWQSSERKGPGDDSFTIMRSRGWTVVPPFEVRTDRQDAKPQNPRRPYRINLARRLCGIPPEEAQKRGVRVTKPRWFVHPRCKFTIKQLQDCELKASTYSGELVPVAYAAHLYDAATYVLCHLEPRPEDQTQPDLPDHLESLLLQLKRR